MGGEEEVGEEEEGEEVEGEEDGVVVITNSHISNNTSSGVETSRAVTTSHEYCVANQLPLL